eukprot:3133733-Rhodomonas_salina.2
MSQPLALTEHPQQRHRHVHIVARQHHHQTFGQATKVIRNALLTQRCPSLVHKRDPGAVQNKIRAKLFADPHSDNNPLGRPNASQQCRRSSRNSNQLPERIAAMGNGFKLIDRRLPACVSRLCPVSLALSAPESYEHCSVCARAATACACAGGACDGWCCSAGALLATALLLSNSPSYLTTVSYTHLTLPTICSV